MTESVDIHNLSAGVRLAMNYPNSKLTKMWIIQIPNWPKMNCLGMNSCQNWLQPHVGSITPTCAHTQHWSISGRNESNMARQEVVKTILSGWSKKDWRPIAHSKRNRAAGKMSDTILKSNRKNSKSALTIKLIRGTLLWPRNPADFYEKVKKLQSDKKYKFETCRTPCKTLVNLSKVKIYKNAADPPDWWLFL